MSQMQQEQSVQQIQQQQLRSSIQPEQEGQQVQSVQSRMELQELQEVQSVQEGQSVHDVSSVQEVRQVRQVVSVKEVQQIDLTQSVQAIQKVPSIQYVPSIQQVHQVIQIRSEQQVPVVQNKQVNSDKIIHYDPEQVLKQRSIKMIYPKNKMMKEFDKYILAHANKQIEKLAKINYKKSKSLQTNSSSNQNEQDEQPSEQLDYHQDFPKKQKYLTNLTKIRPKEQTILIQEEVRKYQKKLEDKKPYLLLATSQQQLQIIYQNFKAMVQNKKRSQPRRWTMQQKKLIVKFVKSGQLFGRDWKKLIKLADIPPSAYKWFQKGWRQ